MKLNHDSIRKICGDATTEVVVFGFGKYDYEPVYNAITDAKDKLRISALNYDSWEFKEKNWGGFFGDCHRICKHTISDLVLENYKRSLENKPIIPLIFCVGKDNAMYDLKEIASKDEDLNSWVSHSELRRCYKLYAKWEETNPAIQKIAELTFKFVKLETNVKGETELKQVPPFWKDPEWKALWEERKKNTAKKAGRPKKNQPWEDLFSEYVEKTKKTKR